MIDATLYISTKWFDPDHCGGIVDCNIYHFYDCEYLLSYMMFCPFIYVYIVDRQMTISTYPIQRVKSEVGYNAFENIYKSGTQSFERIRKTVIRFYNACIDALDENDLSINPEIPLIIRGEIKHKKSYPEVENLANRYKYEQFYCRMYYMILHRLI